MLIYINYKIRQAGYLWSKIEILTMNTQALLQPYTLGDIELSNRVVMAPMTRSRADNPENKPTSKLHAEYYKQRASAGLIISEGSQVSEEAVPR